MAKTLLAPMASSSSKKAHEKIVHVTPRRVSVRRNQDGTVIKTHIRQAIYDALSDTKNLLEIPSGIVFSQSILTRRAIQLYSARVQSLDSEALGAEAQLLIQSYR